MHSVCMYTCRGCGKGGEGQLVQRAPRVQRACSVRALHRQCTRHAADPLRAANYNFGKWETWEPAEGGGFRNRAWGRLLDVEIHEVRSCLASALYENEHQRELIENASDAVKKKHSSEKMIFFKGDCDQDRPN